MEGVGRCIGWFRSCGGFDDKDEDKATSSGRRARRSTNTGTGASGTGSRTGPDTLGTGGGRSDVGLGDHSSAHFSSIDGTMNSSMNGTMNSTGGLRGLADASVDVSERGGTFLPFTARSLSRAVSTSSSTAYYNESEEGERDLEGALNDVLGPPGSSLGPRRGYTAGGSAAASLLPPAPRDSDFAAGIRGGGSSTGSRWSGFTGATDRTTVVSDREGGCFEGNRGGLDESLLSRDNEQVN